MRLWGQEEEGKNYMIFLILEKCLSIFILTNKYLFY